MLQGIIALTSSSPIQICNVIEDAKITFRFIQLLSIVKSVKQKKCFRIGFLIQFCPIFLLFWLSRAIDWNLEISGLLETTTWRLWSTVFKVDFFFARYPPRALQARVLTSVHPRTLGCLKPVRCSVSSFSGTKVDEQDSHRLLHRASIKGGNNGNSMKSISEKKKWLDMSSSARCSFVPFGNGLSVTVMFQSRDDGVSIFCC